MMIVHIKRLSHFEIQKKKDELLSQKFKKKRWKSFKNQIIIHLKILRTLNTQWWVIY